MNKRLRGPDHCVVSENPQLKLTLFAETLKTRKAALAKLFPYQTITSQATLPCSRTTSSAEISS